MHSAHRALNRLILIGILVQFYAAGLAVFGRPFTFHAILGWSLIPASLALMILALIYRRFDAISGLSALLFAVIALQPVFVFVLSSIAVEITALHPLNGLVAFLISIELETRSRLRRRTA